MKRLVFVLAGAAAITAAGVLASASSGGPPPPPNINFGVTLARPVAGHVFTGLTATPVTQPIKSVSCQATINGAALRTRKQHFYAHYAPPVPGPSAITCSWQIPAKAHGLLTVKAVGSTLDRSNQEAAASWRIKRR